MDKSLESILKGMCEIKELNQELGDYDADFDKYLTDLTESYDALEVLGSVNIPVDITNEKDFIKWITNGIS